MPIPTLSPYEKDVERIVAVVRQLAAYQASTTSHRKSILDFGSDVGVGSQTNDDFAMAAAITYLNTLGAEARTCIYWPPGTYTHGHCDVVLTASQCALEAEPGAFINFRTAAVNDTFLQIGVTGGTTVNHVEIIGFDIDFGPAVAPVPQAGSKFLNLQNTFDIHVADCYFRNFCTLLNVGTAGVTSSGVFSTVLRNCSGYGYNMSGAAIQLNKGAGMYVTDIQFYVGGVVPGFGSVAIQNTVTGRYFCYCPATCDWDTFQMDNSLVQFFEISFVLISDPSGICIDFFICNCVLGNNQNYGIFLDCGVSGVQSNFHLRGSWIDNYLGNNIIMTGAGGYFGNHSFVDNFFIQAGSANIKMTGRPTQGIVIAYNRLMGANRSGTAIGAIEIDLGTIGFQLYGNYGNYDDTGAGVPFRAPYGIFIAESCDDYIVTGNAVKGSTGSIGVTPDAGASFARRVFNNQYADASYGGYAITTNLGAVAFFTNTTPYIYEAYVSGGTVTNMIVHGANVGLNHGTFRVEPGETLATNAAVNPLFVIRALG